MADRMSIHKDGRTIYDIVLESSYDKLEKEVAKLQVEHRKLCIVTDTHVAPLYLEEAESHLQAVCRQVDHFVFSAGEEQKNLETVYQLYEFLIQKQYDRGDVLVALGGGVVGDLCGFTAATYLRGIRFIQLPTTLLSQVDSSIGGKTGVDFQAYKNMVGAFHMPSLVYTNVATLLTLPEEQFASGMGEIVKHGLIKNEAYYEWLMANASDILTRNLTVCETMIVGSDSIKRDVVELDPTEQGDRALLNFGHTIGHAIEKLMDFKLLHGQCVSLGCAAAMYISAKRGTMTMQQVNAACQVLAAFGLPVSIKGLNLNIDDIITTTKLDKKMDSGTIKFVLLQRIGASYIERTVTDEEMRESLVWLSGE